MKVGFSGANFAVAETGSVCVVESEGNGRMCVTLPRRARSRWSASRRSIPTFADLEVFLQLLPRSATGERMNPYNSIWTGVTAGDGPEEFHVMLLDNGRTQGAGRCGVARDPALHSLRRLPQRLPRLPPDRRPRLRLDLQRAHRRHPDAAAAVAWSTRTSLPYASSLCGACYEVCPVKINIPEILIHLRRKIVESGGAPVTERMGMYAAAFAMQDSARLGKAQKLVQIGRAPLEVIGMPGWSGARDQR